MITAAGVIKTVHILSMCTWLGVDLGVFLCSRLARDRSLSAEARTQFVKLLGILDLGPRISLLATIPLGLSLTHLQGWGLPGVGAGWFWLLFLFTALWAGLVVRQHHGLGRWARPFAVVDTCLRVAVVVVAIALALKAGHQIEVAWLRWKVALFAAMVACGLWIRYALRDLGPSFAATLSDNADTETFVVVDRQIRAALPPVFLIWTGVVVSIVLAVAKPG